MAGAVVIDLTDLTEDSVIECDEREERNTVQPAEVPTRARKRVKAAGEAAPFYVDLDCELPPVEAKTNATKLEDDDEVEIVEVVSAPARASLSRLEASNAPPLRPTAFDSMDEVQVLTAEEAQLLRPSANAQLRQLQAELARQKAELALEKAERAREKELTDALVPPLPDYWHNREMSTLTNSEISLFHVPLDSPVSNASLRRERSSSRLAATHLGGPRDGSSHLIPARACAVFRS
jgi:hypothetical protein